MIQTDSLQFYYDKKYPLTFSDLHVKDGGQCLIKGVSGSGKTTLIHLLSGILTPTRGNVSINQVSLMTLRPAALDQFRAQTIGLIFQKHLFIQALNMFQNVCLSQQIAGNQSDKEHVNQLFNELKLSHLMRKKPYQLSQGELQRFSIARALANKPKLVIADEPTSSLDDENCQRFIDLIRESCLQYGATLVCATHDARIESSFNQIVRIT